MRRDTLSERSSSSPNNAPADIAEDTRFSRRDCLLRARAATNSFWLADLIASAQPLIVEIIFDGAGISSLPRDREGDGIQIRRKYLEWPGRERVERFEEKAPSM